MKKYRFSFLLILLLSILWTVIFYREHLKNTQFLILHMSVPLPYGASEQQLLDDLNQAIGYSADPALTLRDFFQKTGQYDCIEVRCSGNTCTIFGSQAPLLAASPTGELILSKPLRFASNPYQKKSALTLQTSIPLNLEIEKICQLYQEGFFSDLTPRTEVKIQILADQTTIVAFREIGLEIIFWPLDSVQKKWSLVQKNIKYPLTEISQIDTRYPNGFTYTLKERRKSQAQAPLK